MIFDVDAVRQDFSILDQMVFDHPLVYLDNGASAQMPQVVIEAVSDYHLKHHANVHRGAHTLSGRATELYESARDTVQEFIHAASREEIIFTSGTTHSLNLASQLMADQVLQAGDEILISEMEHHANLIPWQQIAKKKGVQLKRIPLDENEELDLAEGLKLINEKTKVVAVAHVSNVLGVINPVKALADAVHAVGGYLVVDGAQAVPHMPVDVQALDADFYTFSGHKMCGPTGIGVLYGKKELLEKLSPVFYGGEMINRVTFEESHWKELPYKFEPGTPNISGAIGLAAAMNYLSKIGLEKIHAHEQALVDYLFPRLLEIEGLTVYGPEDPSRHTGVIAFNIEDVHPHDVATVFDSNGVAIRAGHHCAEPLLNVLGTRSTARASFYFYNTFEEADRLIEVINKTKEFFDYG